MQTAEILKKHPQWKDKSIDELKSIRVANVTKYNDMSDETDKIFWKRVRYAIVGSVIAIALLLAIVAPHIGIPMLLISPKVVPIIYMLAGAAVSFAAYNGWKFAKDHIELHNLSSTIDEANDDAWQLISNLENENQTDSSQKREVSPSGNDDTGERLSKDRGKTKSTGFFSRLFRSRDDDEKPLLKETNRKPGIWQRLFGGKKSASNDNAAHDNDPRIEGRKSTHSSTFKPLLDTSRRGPDIAPPSEEYPSNQSASNKSPAAETTALSESSDGPSKQAETPGGEEAAGPPGNKM